MLIQDGDTALHFAAKGGHPDSVEVLITNGADVMAKDGVSGGRTALDWAAERGHLDCVEVLLDKGADVMAKDKVSGE